MKKVLVLVMVLVLALSLGAFAFQNEPDGFRGLKWGDPPGEDMEEERFGKYLDITIYTRRNDKMQIGGAELRIIYYEFYEDRFISVEIYPVFIESIYDALKDVVVLKFGDGVVTSSEDGLNDQILWSGDMATIVLRRNLIEGSFVLVINSTQIQEEAERKKEEERQKAAEEGLDDF